MHDDCKARLVEMRENIDSGERSVQNHQPLALNLNIRVLPDTAALPFVRKIHIATVLLLLLGGAGKGIRALVHSRLFGFLAKFLSDILTEGFDSYTDESAWTNHSE